VHGGGAAAPVSSCAILVCRQAAAVGVPASAASFEGFLRGRVDRYAAQAPVALLAVPLAGAIRDASSSYKPVFALLAAITLVSWLVALAIPGGLVALVAHRCGCCGRRGPRASEAHGSGGSGGGVAASGESDDVHLAADCHGGSGVVAADIAMIDVPLEAAAATAAAAGSHSPTSQLQHHAGAVSAATAAT